MPMPEVILKVLGIDQVAKAKKTLEEMGDALLEATSQNTVDLDKIFGNGSGADVRKMLEDVTRLKNISRRGADDNLISTKDFKEAERLMTSITGKVQNYNKQLSSVKKEYQEILAEQKKIESMTFKNAKERRESPVQQQYKDNRNRLKELEKEKELLEENKKNYDRAAGSAHQSREDIGGYNRKEDENKTASTIKKALGWGLAAAGGFSILGFLSQSRAKYQQSVSHEALLGARGIGKEGWNDNMGIGISPLEQAALLENISSRTGMSGNAARNAANMSGAFGRYAGADPSMAAGMYDTMYATTGNANSATGAMGMMTEAFRKGLDKAKSTELMTLISRNTQISAQAMSGTGGNAGSATALAIEALLAQNEGKSYGQYAKSQEFANFMQNGMHDAGSPAGNAQLNSIMGMYNGNYSFQKMFQMEKLRQEGFSKHPDMLKNLLGTFYSGGKDEKSQEERAGKLGMNFGGIGLKGEAALQVIKMMDSGFLDKLSAAARKAGGIEKLKDGSAEEKKLYEQYKKEASALPGVGKLSKEAEKESLEIKLGEGIDKLFGGIERGMIRTTDKLMNGDVAGAWNAIKETLGPGGMIVAGLGLGIKGLDVAGVSLNGAAVALTAAAGRLGWANGAIPPPATPLVTAGTMMAIGPAIVGTSGALGVYTARKINEKQVKGMSSDSIRAMLSGTDSKTVMGGGIGKTERELLENELKSRGEPVSTKYKFPSQPYTLNWTQNGQKMGSTVDERRKQAMAYFMKQGYSKMHAAAIVGNLEHESGLDPDKPNATGSGMYGLAQWDKTRRAAYKQRYGYDITDKNVDTNKKFYDQLDFVNYEANTSRNNAKKALQKTTNIADANKVWEKGYEASGRVVNGVYQGGQGMESRLKYAKKAEAASEGETSALEIEKPRNTYEPATDTTRQFTRGDDHKGDKVIQLLEAIEKNTGVKRTIPAKAPSVGK